MRTILVTGSDTGVGKTRVVGALARMLGAGGARVQIVKVVETGANGAGDADRARLLAGSGPAAFTLASFAAPLAPATAATAEGATLSLDALLEKLAALPPCDWRICEGAGGIATPLDGEGRDWADFAAAAADAAVIVVPDRLGAINQGRLAHARASQEGLRCGVWLNAADPVDAAVAGSNRSVLRAAGVPLWAEQAHGAELPADPSGLLALIEGASEAVTTEGVERVVPSLSQCERLPRRSAAKTGQSQWVARLRRWLRRGGLRIAKAGTTRSTFAELILDRCRQALAERERKRLRRRLRVTAPRPGELNLADNDYLDLARDPAVTEAAAAAARDRTSASASPLVTGWREAHERLLAALAAWHGFPFGLLWNSGYAANSAVLGTLPRAGDLALADRLVHHSMLAGLQRGGARLRRYPHLQLDRLAAWLGEEAPAGAPVWVVTESLFSMDGDYPDLARLAELKRRHGFGLVLDEAHALGWYGPEGSGLARAAGAEGAVDVLVGTLGKTLAAGGAYTLFRDEAVRDYVMNFAGEFIYSTALPPPCAAAAGAALGRVRALAPAQPEWHARSRALRAALRAAGWAAPEGESPIVPVRLEGEGAALALAEHLLTEGIRVAAVRPPTVPAGTSRLRISLKRTFGAEEQERLLAALARGRDRR